jgi:hypothetical protein
MHSSTSPPPTKKAEMIYSWRMRKDHWKGFSEILFCLTKCSWKKRFITLCPPGTESALTLLSAPTPDRSRRPSREEVEAVRLAFRQNPYTRVSSVLWVEPSEKNFRLHPKMPFVPGVDVMISISCDLCQFSAKKKLSFFAKNYFTIFYKN